MTEKQFDQIRAYLIVICLGLGLVISNTCEAKAADCDNPLQFNTELNWSRGSPASGPVDHYEPGFVPACDDTAYALRVRAVGAEGETGPWSEPSEPFVIPEPPHQLLVGLAGLAGLALLGRKREVK